MAEKTTTSVIIGGLSPRYFEVAGGCAYLDGRVVVTGHDSEAAAEFDAKLPKSEKGHAIIKSALVSCEKSQFGTPEYFANVLEAVCLQLGAGNPEVGAATKIDALVFCGTSQVPARIVEPERSVLKYPPKELQAYCGATLRCALNALAVFWPHLSSSCTILLVGDLQEITGHPNRQEPLLYAQARRVFLGDLLPWFVRAIQKVERPTKTSTPPVGRQTMIGTATGASFGSTAKDVPVKLHRRVNAVLVHPRFGRVHLPDSSWDFLTPFITDDQAVAVCPDLSWNVYQLRDPKKSNSANASCLDLSGVLVG